MLRAPVWLWPNLLGLDAPLVAVSWQLLYSRCFGVHIPLTIHLLLGLSVWCVYLTDRLFDAYRSKNFTHATHRLRFTKRHFSALVMAAFLAGCMNLFLILRFVPGHLLLHGLATAGLLALYYAFRFGPSDQAKFVIPREIMCGMVFALGSAIATYSYGQEQVRAFQFLGAVAMLGLVCSASCMMISVWERDADLACGDRSMASIQPGVPPYFRRLLLPLIALYGIVALTDPWQIHVAAGLSSLGLYLMARFEESISPPLLRTLADGVLLTPLLLLPFT